MVSNPQDHGGNRREVLAAWGLDRLLDFSASINPLGQPSGLRAHLAERWGETLHYPDRDCEELRAAAGRAWTVAPEHLLAGNGSAELLDLFLRALRPRRLVLCPPDFSLYERPTFEGLPALRVPRLEAAGFAPDLGRVVEEIQAGDVVLFSNPSNPAGSAVCRSEMLALLAACEARGATLAVDEAFADFCPDVSVLSAVDDERPLVVLRSLTKFYGIPGIRLGLGAAPTALVRHASALQVPWSVSALAQEAGVFCLGLPGWAQQTLDCVDQARAQLAEGLAAVSGVRPLPSRANYLLVELRSPAPGAGVLYRALARQGLLVRHCGSFGLGERYLRVAVRTPEENRELLEALRGADASGREA